MNNNSSKAEGNSQQIAPQVLYTKQQSLDPTTRKTVKFKETNLDDVIVSTPPPQPASNAATLKSILHDHAQTQQAQWLFEHAESNYKSRDAARRNSTLIDAKQLAAFKRRMSLSGGGTGGGGSAAHASSSQPERQNAFKQATFESTIDCKADECVHVRVCALIYFHFPLIKL